MSEGHPHSPKVVMMLAIKQFEHNLLDLPEMETEEGEIRYYLTPHGKFPSMTTLLKALDDGGIDDWIKFVGVEEADKILRQAIKRGNTLHQLSEDYLLNRFDRSKVTDQGGMLFNRAKRHLDTISVVRGIEVPLYSKTGRYAGRADGIVEINNILTILDHKNSRRAINLDKSYARQKIFSYMLQCTGYARALYEMTGLHAKQGMLIISDMEKLTSNTITFKIGIDLVEELDIIIDAYYNSRDIKESMYFKL